MATAAQVVRAILQKILVQEAEADLEPDEAADTVFAMNNYMTELDANGVQLGYTVITNLSQPITIPDGAINGLINNVAILVAPDFDGTITQAIISQARKGLKVMTNLGLNLQPAEFPDTLPIGSGNEFDDFNFEHFYPSPDETILTETNNNILLEGPVDE